MAMTSKDRFQLKKFIKELEQHRGRGTELVTVYIPAGYELVKVTAQLAQEQGTAENIKSRQTRTNVVDALERMIQHLRLFKQTPQNGLAVFSGNVAEKEGQSDVQVWSIEPPEPLNIRLYRCDKTFVLDPLQEMIAETSVYGLVVMDRRDAMLALLRGKRIIPLASTHSEVPGKTRAGGQSAQRFERIREGARKDHYKKIAEYMKDKFLHMKELKGILIGGPSTTTNEFMTKDYLTGDVKKKIIGVKDLSYTGEFGLQELLERSQDVLASEEIAQEKELMQHFFKLLATDPDKICYGREDTLHSLQIGAVGKLLLSESLDDESIDLFEEEARKVGTEVVMVSTETREGIQLRDLGGIAGMLRYAVG